MKLKLKPIILTSLLILISLTLQIHGETDTITFTAPTNGETFISDTLPIQVSLEYKIDSPATIIYVDVYLDYKLLYRHDLAKIAPSTKFHATGPLTIDVHGDHLITVKYLAADGVLREKSILIHVYPAWYSRPQQTQTPPQETETTTTTTTTTATTQPPSPPPPAAFPPVLPSEVVIIRTLPSTQVATQTTTTAKTTQTTRTTVNPLMTPAILLTLLTCALIASTIVIVVRKPR